MSKFEKKFGKYAISNLTLIIILCYVAGYIIEILGNVSGTNLLYYLTLDPYRILHGQIWRLVTWVIVPPSSLNIFTIIMLMFYYNLGTALEATWGTYRYNVYIFSGLCFTVLGAFLCMGTIYLLYGTLDATTASTVFLAYSGYFSTYYINLSIFLAFATTYPDMKVLLMFIIPIKVKWMGIIDVALMAYDFYASGSGVTGIFTKFAIAASLLNFAIFFLRTKLGGRSPKQTVKRVQYQQRTRQAAQTAAHHKCAICGVTDETNPELEFRYCSKCKGNYEYCSNHLFTHEHK